MELGKVFFVKSLAEALDLYAQARATNSPLPTYETTTDEWPTVLEDTRHSYTVEHDVPGKYKYRWSGVVIHVTLISKSPVAPAPEVPAL